MQSRRKYDMDLMVHGSHFQLRTSTSFVDLFLLTISSVSFSINTPKFFELFSCREFSVSIFLKVSLEEISKTLSFIFKIRNYSPYV